MMRSIRWKLTSSYLLLVVLVLVIVTAYVAQALHRSYVNTYAYVVATQAKVISLMMREYAGKRNLGELQPMVQTLKWRQEATIALIDATGHSAAALAAAPELEKAFAGEEAQAVRFDPATGETRVFAAAPILGPNNRVAGVVQVSAPEAWVWRQLRRMAPALGTASLLGLVAAFIVGTRLSRRITRPLEELGHAAERISTGDFAGRAPVDETAELGRLGRTFNTMTDRLQQTIGEITTERKKLEAIVSGMTDAVVATDRHGRLMLLNPVVHRVRARAGPARPRDDPRRPAAGDAGGGDGARPCHRGRAAPGIGGRSRRGSPLRPLPGRPRRGHRSRGRPPGRHRAASERTATP